MDILLRIKDPLIINLFKKMTDKQVGKIIRSYISKNSSELTKKEFMVYQALCKEEENYFSSFKERTLKGWETRRKNGNASLKKKLEVLKEENEQLKKIKKQNVKTENKKLIKHTYNNSKKLFYNYSDMEGVLNL